MRPILGCSKQREESESGGRPTDIIPAVKNNYELVKMKQKLLLSVNAHV